MYANTHKSCTKESIHDLKKNGCCSHSETVKCPHELRTKVVVEVIVRVS